jgi:hypothetical protein
MVTDLTVVIVAALSAGGALAGSALQSRLNKQATDRQEAREDRLRGYTDRRKLYSDYYTACLSLGPMHDIGPGSPPSYLDRKAATTTQVRDQLAEMLLTAPRDVGDAAAQWSSLVQAAVPVDTAELDEVMRAYRAAVRADLRLD